MFGTYVNVIVIIIGSIIGLFLKKGLKENYKIMIMNSIGLSTLFIGGSIALSNLLSGEAEELLFILSLVIGGILGEWMRLDERLNNTGEKLKQKFGNADSDIATGFVTASLIFCVGTMSILGSFNSGLHGDHSILYAKSVLDGVTSIVLSSTLGIGVIFSAVAVLIYQGLITAFASMLEPFITSDMIREITIVGGIMIVSIGLGILDIVKIKTANLLPAILVVVVYYAFIEGIIAKIFSLIT